MIRTRGRRALACHHEAGHAVARWWLGFHSDDVVVLTVDEVRAGVTVTDRRGREHRCEGHAGGYDIHMPMARDRLTAEWEDPEALAAFKRQAQQRVEMEIATSYAGPYAEARYMRRPAFDRFFAGGMGDLNFAQEIAAGWFGTEDEQKAARGRADGIARALVRSLKGWAAMQAITLARFLGQALTEAEGIARR